jgi:hypothetical protein
MLSGIAKITAFLLLGCCLLAVAPGCCVHRTGHGFIISSQWSLEYRHTPWLTCRSANDADCTTCEEGCSKGVENSAAQAADRPELLPWRSRMKGYRLGDRLFRGRESTGGQHIAELATMPPSRALPVKPPPVPAAGPSDDSEGNDHPASSAKASGLELPNSVGSHPEPDRPDLVVD